MEQFSNAGAATLNGAITSGATTLVVSSAVNCPSSGTFRIRIENEILKVTNVSGATWTVVRADGGTTAASHADLTIIYVIVTKEAMDSILSVQKSGTEISTRRTLNFTGATVTDNSGSSRVDINVGYERAINLPHISGFTWLNQGSATAVDSASGGIWFSTPAGVESSKVLAITYPATPFSIIVKLVPVQFGVSYPGHGIAIYDSVSGKLQTNIAYTTSLDIWNLNSFTSWNGYSVQSPASPFGCYNWWKFSDDGTNRSYSFSPNGNDWVLFNSQSRTSWLTPTSIGVFIDPYNATYGMGVLILHWEQTSP